MEIIPNSLTGKGFVERTLEYHKLMVRVNGMLGVFLFIAFEEEPTGFDHDPSLKDLYGFTGICGFLSAVTATIVSMILFAHLTILGASGARFLGGIYPSWYTTLYSYWSLRYICR